MIPTLMLYTLLVSVLVAASARGLEEVFRLARLPVRCVWLGALLATLALVATAALRVALPAAELSLTELAGTAVVEPAASPAADVRASSLASTLATVREAVQWPLRAAAPLEVGRAGNLLGIGWLVLSLGLVLAGAATLLHVRASRRRWPRREIAGTEVRVAASAGPAVLGVLRPEIVVPAWLLQAAAEEQRLVVLHEREHLRARDPLTLAIGCLAVALVPWNPAVWWMQARLRLAVELDCDARVLRRGVRPQAYGALLIDLTGRRSGFPLGVAALAGSPSTLERRLLAMSTRFSRLTAVRAVAFGALGTAALLAACGTELPSAAEIEGMDVAAVESQAQRLMLVRSDQEGITYYLDGVEISAEEARAIAGDRIAQVEVLRSAGEEGARIRIRSHLGDDALDASGIAAFEAEIAEGQPGRMLFHSAAGEGEAERVMIRRQREPGEGPLSIGAMADFEGLLIVDSVRKQASELRNLRPDQIESIAVIKGPAAAAAYDDPRAANGVIRVTTRQGAGSR
jgi:beta-lactamase regulating signal transducer with metallopeptidase domain